MNDDGYEDGKRDGRITALETTVHELLEDINMIKKAIWIILGGIAALQGFDAFVAYASKLSP